MAKLIKRCQQGSYLNYDLFVASMSPEAKAQINRGRALAALEEHPTSEIVRYTDADGNVRTATGNAAVSGTDPVGEFIVTGEALGKPLSWVGGKAIDLGLGVAGKYGSGTVLLAARNRLVGRVMKRLTPETPQTIFFNNVGWGPKETMNVVHKSESAKSLELINPKRWDVVNKKANPNGIWYTIDLGVERTAKNSTPEKAVKAANTRKMFAKRPYTHEGELTLDKPMITVGDIPDRSYLSYYADNAGADGLIYNDIYDNGYNHAREVLSYKLPDNLSLSIRAYKGGKRTPGAYYEFFTTSPKYARNYGRVVPYTIKVNNPIVTDIPLMGKRDPVSMDQYVNEITGGKEADAIIGHDADTGEFAPSTGEEIIIFNPKQARRLAPRSKNLTVSEEAGIPKGERNNVVKLISDNGFSNLNETQKITNIDRLNNFIYNDIYPRLKAQGHDVSKTHIPKIRKIDSNNDYLDAVMVNRNSDAWYTYPFDDVTLRTDPENADFGLFVHEAGGHGIRFNLGKHTEINRDKFNEALKRAGFKLGQFPKIKDLKGEEIFNLEEINLLQEAYPQVQSFGNNINTLYEQGAVNTLFRAKLSLRNGYVTGKDLDNIIKNTSPGEILNMAINQPYTESIFDDMAFYTYPDIDQAKLFYMNNEELTQLTKLYPLLKKMADNIKKAMIKVGAVSGITLGLNKNK